MSRLNIPRGLRSTVSSLASSLTSLDRGDDEEFELLYISKYDNPDHDSSNEFVEEDTLSVSLDDEGLENELSTSQVKEQWQKSTLTSLANRLILK